MLLVVLTRQQRFARNVRENPNVQLAGGAFKTKHYTFPTHEQQDKIDKHGLPHDVDTEVRDLVIDLNDAGYCTGGSCQGHHTKNKGFVTINPHKSEIPVQFLKQRWGDQAATTYVKGLVKDGLSSHKVDVGEVRKIHRDNGVSKINYEKPHFDSKEGDYIHYHSTQFDPIIKEEWTVKAQMPGQPMKKYVGDKLSMFAYAKEFKQRGANVQILPGRR